MIDEQKEVVPNIYRSFSFLNHQSCFGRDTFLEVTVYTHMYICIYSKTHITHIIFASWNRNSFAARSMATYSSINFVDDCICQYSAVHVYTRDVNSVRWRESKWSHRSDTFVSKNHRSKRLSVYSLSVRRYRREKNNNDKKKGKKLREWKKIRFATKKRWRERERDVKTNRLIV